MIVFDMDVIISLDRSHFGFKLREVRFIAYSLLHEHVFPAFRWLIEYALSYWIHDVLWACELVIVVAILAIPCSNSWIWINPKLIEPSLTIYRYLILYLNDGLWTKRRNEWKFWFFRLLIFFEFLFQKYIFEVLKYVKIFIKHRFGFWY